MASLTNYNNRADDYKTLLASEKLDASSGALFTAEATVQPNDVDRTILIGLGGTGVRTIDHVKGVISKKMSGVWERYIAFLGIDTDWTEFDNATYLTPTEEVKITLNGVKDRAGNSLLYTHAQRTFMPQSVQFTEVDGPGAGRKRLIGKFKLHDKETGATQGKDEQIVNMIKSIVAGATGMIPITNPNGKYRVYVIGSVCGGTSSGSFTEIPALVKKAMGAHPYSCNSMLYLPDVVSSLDTVNEAEIKANGYASLKELDYYQGIAARINSPETFAFNDAAVNGIQLENRFYDEPYLVGSSLPGARNAAKIAMDAIAQFLISVLGKIETNGTPFSVGSFYNNAAHGRNRHDFMPGTTDREAPRTNHEKPKDYLAIGYASASAPEKLARAYMVRKLCENTGLKAVTPEARAMMIANGVATLPFRGEQDYQSALEGYTAVESILQPIVEVMRTIETRPLSAGWVELGDHPEITWENVRGGNLDSYVTTANVFINNHTGKTMIDELDAAVKSAFAQFRQKVQEYVEKEGPLAFYNLYKGNFIGAEGDAAKPGIEKALMNIFNGNKIDGLPYPWKMDGKAALESRDKKRQVITDTPERGAFFGLAGKSMRNDLVATWSSAFVTWVNASISDKRKEHVLGDAGALRNYFMKPAALLADQVRAFGYILQTMSETYEARSKKMNSFEEFMEEDKDNLTQVNLTAMNESAYNKLKRQTEEEAQKVNIANMRHELVEAFFKDPESWLNVEDKEIKVDNGKVSLVNEERAVQARVEFDKFMADRMPAVIDVSIEQFFMDMQDDGIQFTSTAHKILEELKAASKPMIGEGIPASFAYLVYPASLHATPNGSDIAAAIRTEANNVFGGLMATPDSVLASTDANCIRIYQVAGLFEMYQLTDCGLKDWEQQYEARMHITNEYFHGLSPVTVMQYGGERGSYGDDRGITWADYFPAITRQSEDPTVRDAVTGSVSVEGQRRNRMNETLDKAKKYGILYSVKNADGRYEIYRVNCDRAIDWDQFSPFNCETDQVTGQICMGKQLATSVANMHGRTLQDISKRVRLDNGNSVMNMAFSNEESAWKFAYRVLYQHIPMFAEVYDTVKLFDQWMPAVEEFNSSLIERLMPAKMLQLIQAQFIYTKDDGSWMLKKDGVATVLAPLNPQMKKFLPPAEANLINNGLLAYFLYTKLKIKLTGEQLDKAYAAAVQHCAELMNDGDYEALEKGASNAEFIKAEQAGLIENGMTVNGDKLKEKFKNYMKSIHIMSEDKMQDIQNFYSWIDIPLE